ncbi:MAG: rhomboid family intramembrane serine protease [Candidatus Aenigmatarchaeota archaeon]
MANGRAGFRWLALYLTGICIVVFVLSQAFPEMLYGNFVLERESFNQKPWTFLTHIFLHIDIKHLYFNMFALAVFGTMFERQAGSRRFLPVFILGGMFSAAVGLFFYSSLLGSSGAIFSLLGCYAVFRPKSVVWVLGVPMYVIVALFVWAFVDLLGIFAVDNTAHVAHLGGMLFGVFCGLYLRKLIPEQKAGRKKPALTERELEEWERKYMELKVAVPF